MEINMYVCLFIFARKTDEPQIERKHRKYTVYFTIEMATFQSRVKDAVVDYSALYTFDVESENNRFQTLKLVRNRMFSNANHSARI